MLSQNFAGETIPMSGCWLAHISPLDQHGSRAIDISCDAASVIEAARDISLTATHPKRSIRFVLFTGDERDMPGSWAYVRSHRAELDHARAAIVFQSDCYRVDGYSLNGRPDIEPALREAMKPIESLGGESFRHRGICGGTIVLTFFSKASPRSTSHSGEDFS